MLTLFLKFLMAHLLGDFVFQPKSWVNDKEKHNIKSKALYAHISVHILCLLIFTGFNKNYIGGVTIIISSHLLIDYLKLIFQNNQNKKYLFFLDQILHIIILLLVSLYYYPTTINLETIMSKKVLAFCCSIIFITHVSSIILSLILSVWNITIDNNEDSSLKNAGKYIGLLERLFVFGFIILGRWEGVGLLLGAKSVFRFGDLTASKNRKLTEYVLIGTLLSFGLAILAGVFYIEIIK